MAIHDYSNPQHFPERNDCLRRLDMELKEVIAVFQGEIIRLEEQLKSVDMVYREQRLKVRIEALQTAISHLETLQKVKEASGVKRKEYFNRDNVYMPTPIDWDIHRNLVDEFNQALDLKDAELAGKLEGLKKLLDILLTPYMRDSERIAIKQTIQELILGKKEG